jgi:hypothetical protein
MSWYNFLPFYAVNYKAKKSVMKKKVTDYRSKVAKDAQQMLEKGVQRISAAEKKMQKGKIPPQASPEVQKQAT